MAKVFGRRLSHAINVLRYGREIFRYPHCRSAARRHHGIAKDTGRAGEDKRVDCCCDRLLQSEGPGDVGINEFLPAMGRDMGLVQRGRVEYGPQLSQTAPDEATVGDRADMSGKRGLPNVEANDLVPRLLQSASETFTKMSSTSSDQDLQEMDL